MTSEEIDREADDRAMEFITRFTRLEVDGLAYRRLVSFFRTIGQERVTQVEAENTRLRAVLASHGISF